jgi:hypothetical protein
MSLTIYIDNHNVLELQALTKSTTGAADVTATVTVTVKDKAGANVTGQTWPATMAHVSAGTYRVTLDSDLSLTPNREYVAHITATGTGGEIGHWELELKAMARSS